MAFFKKTSLPSPHHLVGWHMPGGRLSDLWPPSNSALGLYWVPISYGSSITNKPWVLEFVERLSLSPTPIPLRSMATCQPLVSKMFNASCPCPFAWGPGWVERWGGVVGACWGPGAPRPWLLHLFLEGLSLSASPVALFSPHSEAAAITG